MDGKSISSREAAKIRAFPRSLWKYFYTRGLAPRKWSNAPRSVQDKYNYKMEKWPVLQLCSDNWKAFHLATKTYLQWYKLYHRKIKGFGKAVAKGPPPKKCKVDIEENDTDQPGSDPDTDTVPHEDSDQDSNTFSLPESPKLQGVIHKTAVNRALMPRARQLEGPL